MILKSEESMAIIEFETLRKNGERKDNDLYEQGRFVRRHR